MLGVSGPAPVSFCVSCVRIAADMVTTIPLILATITERLFASASVSLAPDGSLNIQSAPGRYIAWLAAFIVILPLSAWCWRRRIGGHFAPGFFFGSFVIPLIVVPGIATESVRVAPDALTIRTGFWFSPTVNQISLSDLEAVIEQEEAVAQRGLPRRDTFWYFRYHSGGQRRVDLPDLLDANRDQVITYLRQHGFEVRKATNFSVERMAAGGASFPIRMIIGRRHRSLLRWAKLCERL